MHSRYTCLTGDLCHCREMVAKHLPHLSWDEALPPICSFYSYASVRPQDSTGGICTPAALVAPKVPV